MNDWKRKFIIIWTGQLFSILTSPVVQFAIILWISIETGSAEVLSLAAVIGLTVTGLAADSIGIPNGTGMLSGCIILGLNDDFQQDVA